MFHKTAMTTEKSRKGSLRRAQSCQCRGTSAADVSEHTLAHNLTVVDSSPFIGKDTGKKLWSSQGRGSIDLLNNDLDFPADQPIDLGLTLDGDQSFDTVDGGAYIPPFQEAEESHVVTNFE